jgi:oligopeptide transport system permease protein
MLKYIAKRLVMAAVTVFTVATLTFLLMNLIPGGPFNAEKALTPQAKAALEAKYGLDKPLSERYVTYMKGALRLDFGDSLKQRGRSVMSIITTKFPVSAKVALIGVAVALCIGVPLGCISALNRGKIIDNVIIVGATCGIAIPGFVVCTVMLYVFGVYLKILPTMGLSTAANYVMPVIGIAFYPTAYITRLMRSSMLDVLGQDYIRTAKAKGVSGKKIIFGHALKNSLIPVITYFGPMLAYIVTGSLVVEKIFAVPGIGRDFVNSITNRDYPLIMGTTIVLAVLIVTMNLISDILYKVVDPRITLE